MRFFCTTLTALTLALTAIPSAWAAWPDDRAIEVVVGFAPGGGTDLLARKLTPFLQKRLGDKVQFVVVNKPGAGGELGFAELASSEPDGYKIGYLNMPNMAAGPIVKKAPWTIDSFDYVGNMIGSRITLSVPKSSEVKTLADL
eukprot:gene49913-66857_t